MVGDCLPGGYGYKGALNPMSRLDQLPDVGPALSVRQALYRATRDYKGRVFALALEMGVDADELVKRTSIRDPRPIKPEWIEEILLHTGDERLLTALVRPAGAGWYRPDPVEATNEALHAVGKLLEETGEFVCSMHDGAADNVWELHEVAKLEKHGWDVLRAVLGIMAGARRAMEDREDG